MWKARTVLLALSFGLVALLAACQSTPLQSDDASSLDRELYRSSVADFPSPTFTWDHAGPVDIVGIGTGSLESATNPADIVIPDLGSAIAVRVQAAIKYGYADEAGPEMYVEFRNEDDDVLASVPLSEAKSAVTGDFFEAVLPLRGTDAVDLPNGVVRAEVVNDVSFTRKGTEFFTPRSLVAFVLRDDTTPSVRSKGLTSYEDVYHLVTENGEPTGFVQTLTETISFDPVAMDRPLRIDFAISELEADERVIDVDVRVDGESVYAERLTEPNSGNELYLEHVLTTLPAGATDVEIQLFSPDPSPDVVGDSVWLAGVNASVTEPEGGAEGCTPGYWRNHTGEGPGNQENAWTPTGYTGEQLFSSVFDRTITVRVGAKGRPEDVEDPMLFEAVVATGGDVNALARSAVAALLNAAHPDVDAYYTAAEVIEMVQDALDGTLDIEDTKNLLDVANNLGCPL